MRTGRERHRETAAALTRHRTSLTGLLVVPLGREDLNNRPGLALPLEGTQ
jgi:hypothetical protein